MIWFLFSVLTVLVVAVVLGPVWRARSFETGEAHEARVYKLQLGELQRDEERGLIGKAESEGARLEIARRLLKASRQNQSPLDGAKPRTSAFALAPAALTIALGAFVLYSIVGEPSLADQPLDNRLSVPSETKTLSIEIGNLEARLHDNPSDAEAWTQIASAYFKNGDFEKAAGAYRKLIEIKGQTEEALLGLSEALIFGANGDVSPAAKEALNAAVAKNPKSGRGRLWLAIATEQEGNKEEAQKAYRDMLNDDLTGPLRRMVTERLANLTTSLKLAQAPALHGLSGEAPKGHEGNIPEMVERLAERLKANGGTVESWVMLIRSYYVLKEEAKAQEAVAAAKRAFASEPHSLELIDSVVRKSTSPEAKPEEEESASAEAGAATDDAAPADGDFGPAIKGMVSRLADKLKDGGGELEEWLQLIRSYSVLKETDKAQEAAAAARKKFASDPKALEQIEALLKEVNLAAPESKPSPSKS